MRSFISPTTKYMSVVKADAYGHGAIEVSKRLISAGTEYLAVAVIEEALELRNAGITLPILMFTPIQEETIANAIKNNIEITVFTKEIAQLIR